MIRHSKMAAGACALVFLASCGDPLARFDRLSDVDTAGPAQSAAPAEAETGVGGPGFLSTMLGGMLPSRPPSSVATPATVTAEPDAVDLPVVPETAAAPPQSGFLGRLFGTAPAAAPASVPSDTLNAPSVDLAFGEIATVCGLRARDLGGETGAASGYTVYDSQPGATAMRSHFITGFADDCARQLPAAMILFGDVGTYEVVRYSAAGSAQRISATDRMYEQIKSDFCGVPEGQPCGARLDALSDRMTFLTAYQTFGNSNVWAEILLFDGEVVAMEVELP